MKNLFVFILMILLFGCTPENPEPNPAPNPSTTYNVKFVAIGNDNFLIFGVTNSTGGLDSYQIQANQEWTREFNASSGQFMSFNSQANTETQSIPNLQMSLKIYLDGVLWKEANGNGPLQISSLLP